MIIIVVVVVVVIIINNNTVHYVVPFGSFIVLVMIQSLHKLYLGARVHARIHMYVLEPQVTGGARG